MEYNLRRLLQDHTFIRNEWWRQILSADGAKPSSVSINHIWFCGTTSYCTSKKWSHIISSGWCPPSSNFTSKFIQHSAFKYVTKKNLSCKFIHTYKASSIFNKKIIQVYVLIASSRIQKVITHGTPVLLATKKQSRVSTQHFLHLPNISDWLFHPTSNESIISCVYQSNFYTYFLGLHRVISSDFQTFPQLSVCRYCQWQAD